MKHCSDHSNASVATAPSRFRVRLLCGLSRISCVFAVVLGTIASASVPLRAQSVHPYEAEQARLARRALRSGDTPEALLPVLELWSNWNTVDPDVTTRQLRRLAAHRRLSTPTRNYVRWLLAQAELRNGEPAASRAAIQALGYVTDWQVIGPFDNEGKRGFERSFPPQRRLLEARDPQARYEGRERRVGWRAFPDVARFGYVSFDAVMRPRHNVCAFADTYVESERDRTLRVWAGAGGAFEVWWNGHSVIRDAAYRGPHPDRSVAHVSARKGYNRLLVKVCAQEDAWGFFLRLANPDGKPLDDVKVASAPQPLPELQPQVSKDVERPAPDTALAYFERRAEAERPEAWEALARFLEGTDADDPAEQRAKELAARAATRQPTLPRLHLAIRLATDRSSMVRFARLALEQFGDDPYARYLDASVKANGPAAERALSLLEGIGPGTAVGVDVAALRARLLQGLDLPEAARAVLEEVVPRAPDAPGLLQARAEIAESAQRHDEAIALRRRAADLRYDLIGLRRVLIHDALERAEPAEAREHLDAVLASRRGSASVLRYAARVYDAMDRDDLALATYRDAIALAPQDATSHVALARALLRAHQPEAAAEALQRALELRPQHRQARRLLEQLRSRPRFDESFALSSRKVLARRREVSEFPTHVLQNLTVNTVFENGLGSSYRQIAVQIHDEQGARQWSRHAIQYDPGSQRVELRLAKVHHANGDVSEAVRTYDQRLGEPWYRIYYDTRARVVVFPDLRPGDVVELRYRVDDVAHRNRFADYYGDLQVVQDDVPQAHFEYILIAPESRKLHFHVPDMKGLRRSQDERDGRLVHRFVASDVPALESEPRMPGMTEVAPYLHVSTYASWQDVGRWYWGLIHDQLYADASLKQTVRELVAGAPDVETKVRRIHAWVVRHTRYVGLEFGIHGYLPYRVPQIVQRGFGDCKDKASLLYTMLRQAGVESQIVLLRTRRNGRIASRPASLAVFDHAIAYVPALDLYLDGTAEQSAMHELPPQDQGVTVLHVSPDEVELRRTPVMPAEHNLRERGLEVHLADDGSARVRARETVHGAAAASYRTRYQAEGARAQRLERELEHVFPGVELESHRFAPLRELQAPVRFEYRARVPQMATREGDRLRIAPAVLQDLTRSLLTGPTRTHPLELERTRAYDEVRSVRLPPGMEAADVPEGGRVESDFGSLTVEYERRGETWIARTRFRLEVARVAPEAYPAFRSWVQRADALLRARITLSSSSGEATTRSEPRAKSEGEP